MARIKNFWDLKNITSYSSHSVDQFDDNTTGIGGGYFKWIPSNNTSITDIAGIRIKPSTTTDGYWLREYDGPIKVEWFGPNYNTSTFTSLGINQTTLNTRYGTGLVTTTDTYDTAAAKFAFKLMETQGYQSLVFTPNIYNISSSLDLPVRISTTTISIFVIRGNGATLKSTPSATGDIIKRVPPNQTQALNVYEDTKFDIEGFCIVGNNSAGQSALRLGPSYGSEIKEIYFDKVDTGINLEFCLSARVTACKGLANVYGFKADYGLAWGGDYSNSQSNHTQFLQCRVYNVAGATASFYIAAASGCSIRDCIVEGDPPLYGIYFNYEGSPVVKDFTVENTHIEVSCTNAAIYLRGSNGSYHISKIFNQYAQTLIEFDCPTGYPQINVSNISFTHAITTFANKNAGAIWKFTDCELGESPWMSSPANYHPYKASAWKTTGAYFQPVGKYSPTHVLQSNYRCYVIDPILRQVTDD